MKRQDELCNDPDGRRSAMPLLMVATSSSRNDTVVQCLRRIGGSFLALLYAIGGLYYLLSSPPLQLVYDRLPDAGNASVYVPGAGFAGFWYHLGMFQQQEYETQGIVDLENNNYYCYSSGCLSLVLAYLNTTVDDVFQTCHGIQHGWRNGTLSRYEMVNVFLDQLVTGRDFDRLQEFLPRLHILVTSSNHGAEIGVARTREELVNLLVQTTWIPFVTGQGWLEEPETVRRNHGMTDRQCSSRSSRNKYLDGGFSRVLHPSCQHAVHVPLNWNTIVHTLNPSFGRETAFHLWDIGRSAAATMSSADYN